MLSLATALVMQIGSVSHTSPPGGDTVGYWQQRADYTIIAHVDEGLRAIAAQGTMRYVNNSPDTLRELFFHQYLNAFRPGSRWSAAERREGGIGFEGLGEPYYGYERFTRAPLVDGVPVLLDYPGAPDSTVVRIRLPRPLPPGDSLSVDLRWEGRPSALFRRQGRRGRTYDFAQWYPKVAVYDRGGWQTNALVPAGELYGEFGTFDVTVVVRDDQVVGATGIVVSGDPGWARVSRTGPPWMPRPPANLPAAPVILPPSNERVVRFYAENVHHFGWSVSPDYIYEGGIHVTRDTVRRRYPTFDTVGVHVLYKPSDSTTWADGRVLKNTQNSLAWLERLYGAYPYPQVVNLHRLDIGGTEFPMLVMNGSHSYGIALHEIGHIYTYGALANNEWRSAWMDEGLTEYQTLWAQRLSPQDNQRGEIPREFPRIGPGYRANATTVAKSDTANFELLRLELMGRTQPPGTPAADFRELGIYGKMSYDRAALMFGHLRDLMGDSTFIAFLHEYYERWAFRHVDEPAMRASAARAYGANLDWFFDQWVHGTGLMNYGMGADTTVCAAGAGCVTRVRVTRHGELRHPMPIGAYVGGAWVITRARADLDDQWVDVKSDTPPDSIALDPFHVTWDWDWRDNTEEAWIGTIHAPDVVIDWPFLRQENRSRTIVAVAPRLWYSGPQGLIVGGGVRTSYMGLTDLHRGLVAGATRNPAGASHISRLQFRAQADDVYLAPFMPRPLMGVGGAAMFLDGIARGALWKRWDLSPFVYANGPRIAVSAELTGTYPVESLLLPEQWDNAHVTEVATSLRAARKAVADGSTLTLAVDLAGGYASARDPSARSAGYGRAYASLENQLPLVYGKTVVTVRVNGGYAPRAPLQRAIFASSRDPFETFTNNYVRPRRALFKQPDVELVPLGGARLRGFTPYLALESVVSGNVEAMQRVGHWSGAFGDLALWAGPFGDAGTGTVARSSAAQLSSNLLVDFGLGFQLRGRLYDRDINFRLDVPLVANDPVTPEPLSGLGKTIRWVIDWK